MERNQVVGRDGVGLFSVTLLEARRMMSAAADVYSPPESGGAATAPVQTVVWDEPIATFEVGNLSYENPIYWGSGNLRVDHLEGLEPGSGVITATIRFKPEFTGAVLNIYPTQAITSPIDPATIESGDVEFITEDGTRYFGELISDVTTDGDDAVATFRFAHGAVDHLITSGYYGIAIKSGAIVATSGQPVSGTTFIFSVGDATQPTADHPLPFNSWINGTGVTFVLSDPATVGGDSTGSDGDGESGITTELLGDPRINARGMVQFKLQVTNNSNERIHGPVTLTVDGIDGISGSAAGDAVALRRHVNLEAGMSKVLSFSKRLGQESFAALSGSGQFVATTTVLPRKNADASDPIPTDKLFCVVPVLT